MTDKKKGGFMGFLSNVGFIEETPEPAPPKDTPAPVAPARTFSSSTPPTGNVDQEVLAKLEARLQANCPPAYTAFMEMYDSLKEDITDDRQRFKVALKTSHTTSEQLIAALDQLLGTMEAARISFSHTCEENRTKRLGEAEASLKATDDLIATNEQQLKSIQETIASLRTKRETDAQAKDHDAQRLATIQTNFEASHAQVVGRLQAQKSRVQSMPKV